MVHLTAQADRRAAEVDVGVAQMFSETLGKLQRALSLSVQAQTRGRPYEFRCGNRDALERADRSHPALL